MSDSRVIHSINFQLNGKWCRAEVESHRLLVDFLRDDLRLTGMKKNCEVGICGTGTVLIEGKPGIACITPAFEIYNHRRMGYVAILTAERGWGARWQRGKRRAD